MSNMLDGCCVQGSRGTEGLVPARGRLPSHPTTAQDTHGATHATVCAAKLEARSLMKHGLPEEPRAVEGGRAAMGHSNGKKGGGGEKQINVFVIALAGQQQLQKEEGSSS